MLPRAQIFGIALAFTMLLIVLELVRSRRLRADYSLVWLAVGAGALVLFTLPGVVSLLARLLGIRQATSLLFSAGFAFVLWILLSHSLTLTRLWRHDRDAAHGQAELDWQVRRLEAGVQGLRESLSSDPARLRRSVPHHPAPPPRDGHDGSA